MTYQKPEGPAASAGKPAVATSSAASGWLNLGVNLATKFLDSRQDTHAMITNVREKFRTNLRDADFNNDLKAFGGNPLHWACGLNAAQVIRTALEANLPVNECNKLGQTPLHVHCSTTDHLPIVITLLAHEADPLQPDKEGNTPLHIACQHGNVDIAKLLIVFGASVSQRNLANATPWDVARTIAADDTKHAVWRALCIGDHVDEVSLLSNSKLGNAEAEIKTVVTSLEAELKRLESWRPFNDQSLLFETANADKGGKGRPVGDKLLTLDGGGMRGLILIVLLMELEMLAGRSVQDMFDWIAGTSTGGILALALCTGKSLYHCLCLYLRLKNVVFSDAKPHVLRNLETLLQEEFGTELRMSSLPKKPRIMVATAVANRNPPMLHLFRNYFNPNVDPEFDTSCIAVGENCTEHKCEGADSYGELVWKAARNTALAPTYFIQLDSDENFMDGGVMANNPTMAACTEISKFYCGDPAASGSSSCPLRLIVSLGTGKQPTRLLASGNSVATSPAPVQPKPKSGSAVVPATNNSIVTTLAANATSSIVSDFTTFATGYVKATHLAVAQLTDSEGLPVEYSRTLCKFGRISFFRFSPQLERFVELDCTDNATLVDIMWRAKAYVRLGRKAKGLHDLANYLRRWGA